MIAWLCAPVAWLFQDSGRFILQSALAGSVAASLLMVDLLEHFAGARRRAGLAIAFAAIATLIPFGLPALASETAWDTGLHYPRDIDWNRARRLENDLESAGLSGHLVAYYMPLLCPALAVFGPATCAKGGWIEVQPRTDSADALAVEDKVYILPLAHDDPVLAFERRGWIAVHGAAEQTVVVTFAPQPAAARIGGPAERADYC